eukprot:CAMPEP_0178755580 /NCGR_PEP_ID=MMETSP0744-20121128/12801_1 /TAXON_ID=913974 /ORGANISM="Nitzschia punctata, Strain CCMP561" /LENGTH=62 /DNA_ID=CAMNT_0020409633 /DNA_START=111 /DNA_END=299 /DNA_ORIENTATION=-
MNWVEKDLKGDDSVTETVQMSLDGSTWRKSSPYAPDEEDEFYDEPLGEPARPRAPPASAFSS